MQHPSQPWNWKNPSIGRCHSWCSRLMPFKHVMPSKTILSDATINLWLRKTATRLAGYGWFVLHDSSILGMTKLAFECICCGKCYHSLILWVISTIHLRNHYWPSCPHKCTSLPISEKTILNSLWLLPSPPQKKPNDIWNQFTKTLFLPTKYHHNNIPIIKFQASLHQKQVFHVKNTRQDVHVQVERYMKWCHLHSSHLHLGSRWRGRVF